MLMKQDIEKQKDMLVLVQQVRDHIRMKQYTGNKVYKWLADTWSSYDISLAISENNLNKKEDVIEYLFDIAHLFGKDR